MKNMIRLTIVIINALILLFIIFMILLPFGGGKLPASKNPRGLSERTRIEVDGAGLGLILLSEDINNPILLVCGGGPGIPQYLLEDIYPSVLSREFTVCYFDYRGTGTSFDKNTVAQDMTTERYVKDVFAVTDYLCDRFSQEKIFIMGHSFGTYIALNVVLQQPEKYRAYIAMSQITNQTESEYIAFDCMKALYEISGDKKMVKAFSKYNIRESDKDYNAYFFSGLRDKAMHGLGLGTARKMHSVITQLFFPSLRCRAYTQKERINIWRGKIASQKFPVGQDAILKFNAFEKIPELELPVYFVAGKYDCTCCTELQKNYYDFLKAPEKEFYLFENSAHSPLYEEAERAGLVLKEIKGRVKSPD